MLWSGMTSRKILRVIIMWYDMIFHQKRRKALFNLPSLPYPILNSLTRHLHTSTTCFLLFRISTSLIIQAFPRPPKTSNSTPYPPIEPSRHPPQRTPRLSAIISLIRHQVCCRNRFQGILWVRVSVSSPLITFAFALIEVFGSLYFVPP